MKPVFADTSYFIALLSPADTRHVKAVEWSESWSGHQVVTEYVLVELGSALSRGGIVCSSRHLFDTCSPIQRLCASQRLDRFSSAVLFSSTREVTRIGH